MSGIEELRRQIDQINDIIVRTIAERRQIAEQIATAKKRKGLPLRDLARESTVLRHVRRLARRYDLNEDEIEAIFVKIIELCLKAEGRRQQNRRLHATKDQPLTRGGETGMGGSTQLG